MLPLLPCSCSLPSPTARLKATHETFHAMKNGPEAPIAKFFTDQNCGAPNFMFAHTAQQATAPTLRTPPLALSPVAPGPPRRPRRLLPRPPPRRQVMQRYSIVASNVPGPAAPVCARPDAPTAAYRPSTTPLSVGMVCGGEQTCAVRSCLACRPSTPT